MEDLYLKTSNAYIQIMWSSNESLNPDAVGVIGIYVYDLNGNEHKMLEGGEFDIFEDKSLESYIPDIFEFIELPEDTEYEIISEEYFDNIIYGE